MGTGALDLSVLQSDAVLRPFVLGCQTKQPKIVVLALSVRTADAPRRTACSIRVVLMVVNVRCVVCSQQTVQKLLQNADSIKQKFLSTVIGTLRIHAEIEDDSTAQHYPPTTHHFA